MERPTMKENLKGYSLEEAHKLYTDYPELYRHIIKLDEYIDDLEDKLNNLVIADVSKSLNADELINSLGTPDVENEYILKPDTDGTWWMEHKHVGSGEPLEQWLTGKP